MPEAVAGRPVPHPVGETFDSPDRGIYDHHPGFRVLRVAPRASGSKGGNPQPRSRSSALPVNAPDSSSTPEPRALSAAVRDLLGDAIASVYREDGAADGKLRDALKRASAEARERGLRPEELIVSIKTLLDDLPSDVRGLTTGDQLQIRDRIVSACIRAYFNRE